MAINKTGLNISALTDATPPEFNISNSSTQLLQDIPQTANDLTNGYFGLGILIILFFYLVWKYGKGLQELNEQYSTVRTVGMAAGVCAILGLNFLALGFFTNYFHVVIFMGLTLVSTLLVYMEDKR